MQVNPNIFRGYDIRGLVDIDLSPEFAEALGKAYGTYLKRLGINQAIVGHDCRATGVAYSAAVIRGLTWAGVSVFDIGMTLVGTFYWSQYYLQAPGAIYVSASHNPPEYNGFKIANGYSETLVSDGVQELRRMIEQEDFIAGVQSGIVESKDIKEAYYEDLLKRLSISKKFKVLIDPGNTTAGVWAPELLRRAGCEVIEKNTTIDSSFPLGVADPTEQKVADRLRQGVLATGADIGFTYDADADRIGIVDEKGGIIWNDVLVALFAIDVLRLHPGATIMFNTLCSKIVPETITANGGKPFMWRTGHSFLKKKNQEIKAAFIGELSGHFFFSADFYNHDDGLYSTLRLLQYLSSTNQTLSEAVASLPRYISSPEIKVFTAEDKKVTLVNKLSQVLKKDWPQAEIIDDERAGDGLRLDLPDAMFVIRYSQNGPYMTIKFEAREQRRYEELKKYISTLLHSYEEVDWSSAINVNVEALE